MKRSIRDTGDGSSAQKPPAKRAATAKRAAASKKTAAQATESPEPVVIAGPAPAASPSPSSSIPNTRRVPVGPNGEFFIPRTFPRESIKALDKMVVSKRWVQIDGDPNHEFTLGNRRWWELNSPWLEANKKSIGLTAKHWKMREEAFAKGEPRGDDEGDNPEDFVCISPPALEARDSEEDEDEDEDEEEEEDEENEEENEEAAEEAKASKEKAKEEQCAMHKVVGKLASLHPEHKWVSTMRGNERSKWWISELLKRDQDDFLMHVYNDFTWYGTIEVMENIFVNFEKVLKRKNHTVMELWFELEGLALVLNSGCVEFQMCDDADRCGQILELVGYMTITVIGSLQKNKLFAKDSQIPNIGIMLALVLTYAHSMGTDYGWEDQVGWTPYVVQQATVAHITLAGPKKFAETLQGINEWGAGKTAASQAKWAKGTFPSKLAAYGSRGGNQFDITTFSAAERKKYSFA
ncbi:uncharacterized protein TRIREDRAFT_124288 [Trichoderma reesei QM6a]|uniref:Predicted protein n=2 Tax=Hypocrea jecorina TaxID=51453 RepID=G0RXK9_HYPJQ|nr:uncharacterized protein TRIREDRAFT_124288 [Trichoderma reesei QM6a]EGR44088.1 predicted protein [Trichoderma reesei QM6a]ETR96734.1 hypothetical protein M419DRAFT_105258 [Trichoderma reesei RUT C-30]